MKKIMKIAGVIGLALITTGALFRIEEIPVSGAMFIGGFFAFGLLYFPASIITLRKESHKPAPLLMYVSGLSGGLFVLLGTLIKVMNWQGSEISFNLGYGLLTLVFIPLVVSNLLNNPGGLNRLSILFGGIAVFLCMVGSLLKINHYPGALFIILCGSFSLTLIFLPIYTLGLMRRGVHLTSEYIFITIAIVYCTLFNLFISIH